MANPTATTYLDSLRALSELDGPDKAEKAAKSLTWVLRQMPHGYVTKLANKLDVDRHTITNWRDRVVPITPIAVLQIAQAIVHDVVPEDAGTRDQDTESLVTLLYSESEVEAAKWILDLFSTHSPWNALYEAA